MIYCDRCGAAMDDEPQGKAFVYITRIEKNDTCDFERTLCNKCYLALDKFLDGEGGEDQ